MNSLPERVDFAARGTPIQRVDRLADALDLPRERLWVKRDDLTGLSGGGNKARKLEHLVAAALRIGADTLVTTGAAQSNHVRATAAAARTFGLECVAVLTTLGSQHEPEGNLLLDGLFGARVVWCAPAELTTTVDRVLAGLTAGGSRPYYIPLGGTNPLGAAGYVTAADEIEAAVPGAVVACAVGTGGTQAGLAVGLGSNDRVLGFDVAALTDLADRVPAVIAGTAELLGRADPTGSWTVHRTTGSAPYGAPTEATWQAIRLVADTTGLVLDPVYTGRAMAGLIAARRSGDLPDAPIVFLHSGGMPALFTARYRDWVRPPQQWAPPGN